MLYGVCLAKAGLVREDLGLDLKPGVVTQITEEQAMHFNKPGRKGSLRNCWLVEQQ